MRCSTELDGTDDITTDGTTTGGGGTADNGGVTTGNTSTGRGTMIDFFIFLTGNVGTIQCSQTLQHT